MARILLLSVHKVKLLQFTRNP